MSQTKRVELRKEVLSSMGGKFRSVYLRAADAFKTRIADNPRDFEAHIGLADTNILIYVFGYSSREETLPDSRSAHREAADLDPSNSEISRLTGVLSFLDWDWRDAEASFKRSIETDPQNLAARHWYSLYLVAMGRFEEAMAQSDAMMQQDPEENYLIGRGSLLYFQHRFAELKELMLKVIANDPTVPWGYDWLGMAHNGLGDHDDALKTYSTAFELSDGTAEVGGGFGHALGEAGETEPARQISDFYASIANDRYVPPVQRAFIHIGLGEHDRAIELLEQAYDEKSWFLIFLKVEPWLDPLRDDATFAGIERGMGFPD